MNGGKKRMKLSDIVEVIVVVVAAIVIASVIASMIPVPILKTLIGILAFFVILRVFVRNTKVEEGTAKLIMRWGGVVKVFIQWTGYRLDEQGNVVWTGEKNPWEGGLRVWIGLPIDKAHQFKLRWHSIEEKEGKRVPVFHEKITDNVDLRPDRYWRKSFRAETKDGMFIDIEWLIGMRSINPENTIFKSPHNWVENALTQLEPLLRRYIYTKDLEEVIDLTREGIWNEIGSDRAIQKVLKEEWGIQIDENEIGIFDVGLPPGYQEALARAKQMELETKAKIPIEEKEREAEKIELQHVRDRAIEIRDGVGLSPKDAIEVVQTERAKVVKQIIEYKGLEGVKGLPLISIGGERMPKGKREEKDERRKKYERFLEPLRE